MFQADIRLASTQSILFVGLTTLLSLPLITLKPSASSNRCLPFQNSFYFLRKMLCSILLAFVFLCVTCFWDKISCIPDWTWAHYVVEVTLSLTFSCLQLPSAEIIRCASMPGYEWDLFRMGSNDIKERLSPAFLSCSYMPCPLWSFLSCVATYGTLTCCSWWLYVCPGTWRKFAWFTSVSQSAHCSVSSMNE